MGAALRSCACGGGSVAPDGTIQLVDQSHPYILQASSIHHYMCQVRVNLLICDVRSERAFNVS